MRCELRNRTEKTDRTHHYRKTDETLLKWGKIENALRA